MRAFDLVAMLSLSGWAVVAPGFAQEQSQHAIVAEHKDIGRIETSIVKFDQALGVLIVLHRAPGDVVDCTGTCFFPNSRKALGWQCAPDQACNLLCTTNPPVGGCK